MIRGLNVLGILYLLIYDGVRDRDVSSFQGDLSWFYFLFHTVNYAATCDILGAWT